MDSSNNKYYKYLKNNLAIDQKPFSMTNSLESKNHNLRHFLEYPGSHQAMEFNTSGTQKSGTRE